jgi:hypothetical protein
MAAAAKASAGRGLGGASPSYSPRIHLDPLIALKWAAKV